MARLKEHFINSFVMEIGQINGTEFEYLCGPVLSLIIKEDVEHKGHNLCAKPVGYTADLLSRDYEIIGQCGTESNYFDDFKKPIKDVKSSIKNHKKCKIVYLFTNLRATGKKLTDLDCAITAKFMTPKVIPYDAEKIANAVLDNISNASKIEEILGLLPKTFEYYRILPQANKLPAFKTKYYERKEENEIVKKIEHQDYIQIFGISGIGKTELTISIGNKVQNEFDSVIWLNGNELENTPINLQSIHINKFKDSFNLSYFLQELKVLVIVDNLNSNVIDFINLFKSSNKHNSKCIISSLQRDLQSSDSYELSFLDRNIAENMLLNAKIKPELEQIKLIIDEISGYPLVLNLITSAIEVDDLNWDEIISEIKNLKNFPDSSKNKLSQRIIGKFIKLLENELQWIKRLNNQRISRHFFDEVLGKKSISELEKRSLIKIQDFFFFNTHQVILESIKSEITKEDDEIIHEKLESYLSKNNEIKSIGYFRFLLNHMDFIKSEYSILEFPNKLKKIILYALVQPTDSFNYPEWFLQQFNEIILDIEKNYIDLLLFIEKSEIELFQHDRDSDNYREKHSAIITTLNNVLTNTVDIKFKILLYHHIGKFLKKNKDYVKAEEYFRKVLKLNENADYTRLQLARLYINIKEIEKAEKEIELVFSKEHNLNKQSWSILLSFYELLSQNDLKKLRDQYIGGNIKLFIKSILFSLDSNFEQPYRTIEKLSGYLSYEHKEIYNEICENLPFPSNIDNNKDLRLAFAKIKLSQYKMLKYVSDVKDREKEIVFKTSEKYFKTIDLQENVEKKPLLDLYIAAEQYEKALEFSKEFKNKEDSFFWQNMCKIWRGMQKYDEAIDAIDKAILYGTNVKKFYIAAFLNDKAEALHNKNDKSCIDFLQKAIDKQHTQKTKEEWNFKKGKWIKEFKP